MNRYSAIDKKIKREIVLLKGRPCLWGRCSFCDYTEDNSPDERENARINSQVLAGVTGRYGVLEVINSGNIFELPAATLGEIRRIIGEKGIHTLFFESHWIYRKKLRAMRDSFPVRTIVKTGVETFDVPFRENVLMKGFGTAGPREIRRYFDSVCLLVGVKGQTRESVAADIKAAFENFDHFTVNVYMNNSTAVKADPGLIDWFRGSHAYLDDEERCDVLWANTDFGVGD